MSAQEVRVEDVLSSGWANFTQQQEGETVQVRLTKYCYYYMEQLWHYCVFPSHSSYGVGNQSVLHFTKRLRDKNRQSIH